MLKKLSLNIPRILILSTLVGCAANKRVMGETFEFTESPCLDGVVLNISNSKCEALYTGRDPATGGIKLRCTLSKETSLWTETRFFMAPHSTHVSGEKWVPFCSDHYGTVYIEIN